MTIEILCFYASFKKRNKTLQFNENEKLYQQFSLILFDFMKTFATRKERRKFFVFIFFVKSQHKEGLYHCERRSLCVWIFFLILLVMCTRNDEKKTYALSSSEKKFPPFLNIFYLLRIEFFFFCERKTKKM